MATIQDILAINNYRGQGYAGGNVAVSVDLNTSQLNQVAQLTYYQNKDRYERNNKLKDEAAGILAEQMATDVSSVDPKIAKLLLDKKNAIGEMAENSFAFNRDKDPELFIKMEKEIGDLTNLLGANKKNQLIYNQEKKRIDGLTDLAEREREQEKFDLTNKIYYEDGEKNLRDGIYLGYEAPPQPISFGDFVGNMVEYDVFEKGANNDLVYTHKILDQASTEAQLRKIGAGLEIPKYKTDPSLSQDKNRLKELALAASYKTAVRQTMQNTDELLKSSDQTTLKRTTSEIENFNAQVERYNELLRTGELKDKKGNVLNKGYVGNFKPITLEKTTNADGTESYFLDDYEKAALALFNSGKFKLIDEVKVKNDYTGEKQKADELAEQKAARKEANWVELEKARINSYTEIKKAKYAASKPIVIEDSPDKPQAYVQEIINRYKSLGGNGLNWVNLKGDVNMIEALTNVGINIPKNKTNVGLVIEGEGGESVFKLVEYDEKTRLVKYQEQSGISASTAKFNYSSKNPQGENYNKSGKSDKWVTNDEFGVPVPY